MLTSFRNINTLKKANEEKKEQEKEHNERLRILFEAIDKIEENSNRIYIEDFPYRAELKLPAGLASKDLKSQEIKTSESRRAGEGILVHTFLMSGKHPSFEVWYTPISAPRL